MFLNHPNTILPFPGSWKKNYLLWTWSQVPKRLGKPLNFWKVFSAAKEIKWTLLIKKNHLKLEAECGVISKAFM